MVHCRWMVYLLQAREYGIEAGPRMLRRDRFGFRKEDLREHMYRYGNENWGLQNH